MPGQDPFINALRDWLEESMHRSIHAFIRHNRQSALSLSQTNSLFRLYHHGPSPVNDLANHLGITMAAVSQLLAPLEESDLIQRSEDPSDRRIKQIALTDKGYHKVQDSMRARHAWLEDLAAMMTPEEKAELLPAILLMNKYSHALKLKSGHHSPYPCANTSDEN